MSRLVNPSFYPDYLDLKPRWVLFFLIISVIILLLPLTALYNITLHPLRHFPGPFLARCSSLWGFSLNLHGRRAHEIQKAHEKYGPVIRVAPNLLSFSNPKCVREIYNSKVFVKAQGFYRAKKIFHENHLLSFRDPIHHGSRRKLLSRGFSQAALLEFEPQIGEKVRTLLDQWAKLSSTQKVIDIYPWAHMFGFDTIYHLMFGIDPGSLKEGKESSIMPWLRSWRPTFNYKELFPFLEQWGPRFPGPVGQKFRNVQSWKVYATEVVRSCRKDEIKTAFLSRVLDGIDASLGRPLTDSELAEECMGGMFGGSGTTANTFVFALWGTLRNKNTVECLNTEISEAFSDKNAIPDSVTCANLPYLNAILQETLRLYPTIIAMLPRTATEDTILDGKEIPRGTNVGTQNLTIHRCEAAFPEPEKFIPERWLDCSPEQKEALVPFSVGPRKCIGSNLAEMELRILLAAFFLRFDVSVDSSVKDEDMELYDSFSASPVGGKFLLNLREKFQR